MCFLKSRVHIVHIVFAIAVGEKMCIFLRVMIDIEARGPTHLVQHFAYRGSSLRRKGAAIGIILIWFGYFASLWYF